MRTHQKLPFVRLAGLIPDAIFKLEGSDQLYTGAALMHGGFVFGDYYINNGDYKDIYPTMQAHFIMKK